MKPYFERMTDLGKALSEQQLKKAEENVKQIKGVEKIIDRSCGKGEKSGFDHRGN